MFLRLVGVYSELKICANTKLFKESERERERGEAGGTAVASK